MQQYKRTHSQDEFDVLIKQMDTEIKNHQNKNMDASIALEVKCFEEKEKNNTLNRGKQIEITEGMFYKLISRTNKFAAFSCLHSNFEGALKEEYTMFNGELVRRNYFTQSGKQVGTYYTAIRRCFVNVNKIQEKHIQSRSVIFGSTTYPLNEYLI